MSEYIKKIQTDKGEKQIDYNALANLPKSDTSLSKGGFFADAKVTGEKIEKLSQEKVNINQGIENSGKIFAIDEQGNMNPINAPEVMDVVYHSEEHILEFVSKAQLPGNVGVDNTLTISGNAADAIETGDKLNRLLDMIMQMQQNGGIYNDENGYVVVPSNAIDEKNGYIDM